MIDSACNYLNPYATVSLTATTQMPGPSIASSTAGSGGNEFRSVPTVASAASMYDKTIGCSSNMKMEMQYPPQTSSTGSVSPNSSTQSTPSSASVSPSIFPSPAQSFASISSSPPSSATSASPLSGSHSELGAAAAASAAYSWNTAAYTAALPTRTQFPYAQYASDYYGNVGMSAASAGAWFSHQDRLYQPWSGQTYPSFNFDDIAFQTQLQRRSVRCTCPNCTNEMSGLPPIVGPDERGRKQHICHIPGCERLYGKASHLKTHLRWHTGERPFLCLTCGKRFSRSDELQRHGRTHTNYRPYACPICSKKFSRSDHLSKHKKTHFKDKKSKKSQVVDVKTQGAAVKQEKSNNAGENLEKSSPIKSPTTIAPPIALSTSATAKTVASATTRPSGTALGTQQDVPQLQLKTEQPDPPAGYTPYTNLYHHQSSALFQPHMSSNSSYGIGSSVQQTTAAPPTFDLWNSHHHHHHHHHNNRSAIEQHQQEHQQSQHQLLASTNSTHSGIMTNTSNNLHQPQTQQQQQQAQLPSQHQSQSQSQSQTSRLSSSPVATSSGGNMSQHYAALTMQSETQLAADYGLTMSSTNGVIGCSTTSTPVIHPHPHSHPHVQHPATYSGLIGQMKTEYPSYPEFPTNSYSTASSAFHHHAHNPWTSTAAYQQSHATA